MSVNDSEINVVNIRNIRRSEKQVILSQTIGKRLREARMLCQLTLTHASTLLGYYKPSALSKVESAYAGHHPLWLIQKAAIVYNVSSDFLLGLTDDFECDPVIRDTNLCTRWLLERNQEIQARELALLARLGLKIDTSRRTTAALCEAVKQIVETGERLRELNKRQFDGLKAGSRFLLAIENASKAVHDAQYALRTIDEELTHNKTGDQT